MNNEVRMELLSELEAAHVELDDTLRDAQEDHTDAVFRVLQRLDARAAVALNPQPMRRQIADLERRVEKLTGDSEIANTLGWRICGALADLKGEPWDGDKRNYHGDPIAELDEFIALSRQSPVFRAVMADLDKLVMPDGNEISARLSCGHTIRLREHGVPITTENQGLCPEHGTRDIDSIVHESHSPHSTTGDVTLTRVEIRELLRAISPGFNPALDSAAEKLRAAE